MLPYFFHNDLEGSDVLLDEETSRHIVQVLRMDTGEHLLLTDGRGNAAEAEIITAHKKSTRVNLLHKKITPAGSRRLTIAISLIKNSSRFEWFLEKATELGVYEVIPMICERTEREKFRFDRLQGICKSAMLQSMQTRMPVLHEATAFADVVSVAAQDKKLIAHCEEEDKRELPVAYDSSVDSHIILIGPEGDFTSGEINAAKDYLFDPVSLGKTRLRVETAALFAAVICR